MIAGKLVSMVYAAKTQRDERTTEREVTPPADNKQSCDSSIYVIVPQESLLGIFYTLSLEGSSS